MTNIRIILLGALLAGVPYNLIAQKLPKVQQVGMPAPAGIKIDGSATEWGNAYQAFNKPTGIFYSIANDDDHLYLIVHSTESRVIEKILEGGISFIINDATNNDHKTRVLFPLLPMPVAWSVLTNAGKKITERASDDNPQHIKPDNPDGITKTIDSILNTQPVVAIATSNNLLEKNLKEIKVSGIRTITDTVMGIDHKSVYYLELPLPALHFKLIPINNQDSIKAMVQFDLDGALTYELALPIKYITSSINKSGAINYQIILNARNTYQRIGSPPSYERIGNQSVIQNIDLETPTSLKGKYTLVKK